MKWLAEMFRVYIGVSFFRRSLKETPSSHLMLGIALVLFLLMNLVQINLEFELSLVQEDFWIKFGFAIFDFILFAIYVWFWMWKYGRLDEYLRCLTIWVMFMVIVYLSATLLMTAMHYLELLAYARTLFLCLNLGIFVWVLTFISRLFWYFITKAWSHVFSIVGIWILLQYAILRLFYA
jgi:hypothetical protein